jgi:hypothetical protein
MPELSSLHTSRPLPGPPLQQLVGALIMRMPPSGRYARLQMLPTPLQAWPLSQRPLEHRTVPLGLTPPPQHASSLSHEVPVSRQPPAGRHTLAPEPGSKQVLEQQPAPSVQGLPSWVQPPPPLPVILRHRPTPPSFTEQTLPQHSAFQ